MSSDPNVVRIKPHAYIHILDNNSNVARLEVGPQTYTRKEHEQIVVPPREMIMIPPRHYCIISNPIVRDAEGVAQFDEYGNARLRHGDQEVRFEQKPFALYPGEVLFGKVTALQVVAANAALRLRAIRDFVDAGDVRRQAGEEWLFPGPGTYIPRIDVQVVEIIRAQILKDNEALRLRARRAQIDSRGKQRQAGEEWLHRDSGAYLPNVDEEIVGHIEAKILTDKKALHLRATQTFVDVFGHERKAGSEWLVTLDDTETHIPDIYEEVVKEVPITTLSNRQFCVVVDYVDEHGVVQWGKRQLRQGERSFFLQPGERLENGIQNIYVLRSDEALLLRAVEPYEDKFAKKMRQPGELWLVPGAAEFVPEVSVEIVEKRRQIPLDKNEGIYVRNIGNGSIRSVIGESYMLQPDEELWEKPLPDEVESLLSLGPREYKGKGTRTRDRTRVVTYRAPHNSAVQVHDYKTNKSRVVFGPDLVMLEPDEQFTVLSLSGGKPKVQDQIKSLCLLLGPDFMTDIVTVETSDHARLSLQLAYNWMFEFDRDNADEVSKLFGVPDFVGDATKAIASRVRGAVAASGFDNFHRQSATIIHQAVFGASNKVFKFTANNLVITNIDIQSVEPVDQRTRDSLQKSVQLAIEITTKSQEAAARHEAERKNQAATGRLEIQKINDEAKAEAERVELLRLQAMTISVEATGQATADAVAKSDAALIVGKSEVEQAKLRTDALRIKLAAELEQLKSRQKAEIDHRTQLNELELAKAEELAQIESAKFKQIVDSIGADTITAIAQAGPEMQAKLLGGLGLQGFMITDGNSPINLFGAAQGFIGAGGAAQQAVTGGSFA
jgi:major vault protein